MRCSYSPVEEDEVPCNWDGIIVIQQKLNLGKYLSILLNVVYNIG